MRSSEVSGWYFPSYVLLVGLLQVKGLEEWQVLRVTPLFLGFGSHIYIWYSHAHFLFLIVDCTPLAIYCELVNIVSSPRNPHRWLQGGIPLQGEFFVVLWKMFSLCFNEFGGYFPAGSYLHIRGLLCECNCNYCSFLHWRIDIPSRSLSPYYFLDWLYLASLGVCSFTIHSWP